VFDPLDPFDPQPAFRRPVPPATPAEEESFLQKVQGVGLGGLAFVGGALEKLGARPLRGLLGGRPRELLSLVPFSDAAGLTRYEDRVSGKELLGYSPGDDGWGPAIAGFGLEAALDPLTWASFGSAALTRAGQVAQKAGVLPKTAAGRVRGSLGQTLKENPAALQALEDAAAGSKLPLQSLLDEPLGYSVGFGVPFMTPAGGLGEGGLAAGRGVAALGRGLWNLVPGHEAIGRGLSHAGRVARANLDSRVLGAVSKEGQKAGLEASEFAPAWLAPMKEELAGIYRHLKGSTDDGGAHFRSVLEGVEEAATPQVAEAAARYKALMDQVPEMLRSRGVPIEELDDVVEYATRYMSALARPTPGYGRGSQPLLASSSPALKGRRGIFKGLPGGTKALEDLAVDPAVLAGNLPAGAARVRRQYLGMTEADEARLAELQAAGPALADPAHSAERAALLSRWGQAEDLARWARDLDPQIAASAKGPRRIRVFGNHPLADAETYLSRVSRLLGGTEASHNLLARTAIDTAAGAAPAGAVDLLGALKQAGLTELTGAQKTALERLNAARAASGQAAVTADDLGRFVVPRETAAELRRYLGGFTAPEAAGQIGGALDWYQNLFKALQTAPWPAFHVRNLASGLWQNWVAGAGEAPGGLLRQLSDARALLQGKALPGLEKEIPEFARRAGLTSEKATALLADEMYARGVGGHNPHLVREVLGSEGRAAGVGAGLEDFGARIPGERELSLSRAFETYTGRAPGQEARWFRPDLIQGVNANADLHPLVAGGRHAGDLVEGTNRGALYLSLRRQGYSADEAARKVLAAHFDYSKAAKTPLESQVLSRLVPFYTYARQNLPYQVEQLLSRPGGAAGQAARAALDFRSEGFLPSYLGGGLAVPLGGEDESGTRRYLTRLDLPPEQAFETLRGGPDWLADTMLALAAQTGPAVKAPLEYATGKQFYSGRDLDDLHPVTDYTFVDNLIANSPFSRVATTARQLLDPRKYAGLTEDPVRALALPANLLTGGRVTDVDVARQRDLAEREYLKETLQAMPEVGKFQSFYLRPGMEHLLTPQEYEMLKVNALVEKRARDRGRQNQARR
jgi:hypothetical protein